MIGRRTLSAGAVSIAALVAASACAESGRPRLGRVERPKLGAGPTLGPLFTSPARLRYHPRERARSLSERVLTDGRRLIVGEGGERWLYDQRTQSLETGAALAPEGLIGTLESKGELWFVGASGTTYAASGWLEPFERSIVPAEPLSRVSSAGSAIVGIGARRSLVRSTDFGATWSATGPSDATFVDVAMSPTGVGMALTVPEALYETSDFGATFRASSLPPTGVLELGVEPSGELRVTSVFGEKLVGADGRLVPRPATSKAASELPPPPRGPDAFALAEGRAVIDGARYLELAPVKRATGWELWQGKLDGPLEMRPFPEAKLCGGVRLAAFGRYVAFACFRARADAATQPISIHWSDSGGRSFQALPGRLDGKPATFRLALGDGGHFVLTGVCPPSATGGDCVPSGVQHGRGPGPPPKPYVPGGPKRAPVLPWAGTLSSVPSLSEAAHALAYSYDGKTAYAVGRRTKTGRFALFVSRDGGMTFEPEDLELVPFSTDDDDAGVERSNNARVEALSPAEDGAVALTFSTWGRRLLLVTDDRGKLLSSAEPPEARSLLGAAGLRAISINPATRQLWESVDGGVTFQPISRLPVEVCPGDAPCELPIRCAAEGCVVGQKLSRIGWGGQVEDQASVLPPPLKATPSPVQRRLRTPLACTLDPTPWRALAFVEEPPGVGDAVLGDIDWYVVAEDADRAALSLFVAENGRVSEQVLFAPSERPEERAFALVGQVEGIAALRYRIPESIPGSGNLSDVEVAWSNFFEGRIGRARLKDGGPFSPGDYEKGATRAQIAAPDLMSVASRGLYLRLHHAGKADQPTLFLDGKRAVTLPQVTWPKTGKLPARMEIAHVDDAHVPVLLVGRGAAVLRARPRGAGYEFDALSTGFANPTLFGLSQTQNVTYVGDRAGVHLELADDSGSYASAAVYPFQATGSAVGAAVPVPTQLVLGDRPSACTPERRAKTPRVVASPLQGTRHPVVVIDSVEGPRTFLTGAAVLHGTPGAPCAAAFGATFVSLDGSPAARESALILLDTPERSALFRVVGDREALRVEQRSMTCRFDPTLEVPGEIYRALGSGR